MIVHRISSSKFINDLSGRGAWLNGGRWNSPARYMLYAAESLSLAAWEVFVNIPGKFLPNDLSHAVIFIPDEISHQEIHSADLPTNWTDSTSFSMTRAIGDAWLESGETLVLKVPSAVTLSEHNYLINPQHPDFSIVKIQTVEPFEFDPRVIK